MQEVLQMHNSVLLELDEPLVLESGDTLPKPKAHFTTYGELNKDKSNVVWVFHALTANSDPTEWWTGVVGGKEVFNPEEHYIICVNMLGSCYGSSEPQSFDFPFITIKDIVALNQKVRDHLGINRVKFGIGGSMGGQQLLEWAVQEPDFFETIVPIATNSAHSPWGIAFNEAQRMALQQPDLAKGVEAARAIAMLSYRHYQTYQKTQLDTDGRQDEFSAGSYQRYQGEKLRKRFSPYSYWYLSKAMDSHNIGTKYGGLENALKRIRSRAIVMGVDTDILFPSHEQAFIASHIENSSFHQLTSEYGHDGFLIEAEQITSILKNELE
ncbi:MAG: homoserine O-acetyltransferase [Bacteroidota bacterium]